MAARKGKPRRRAARRPRAAQDATERGDVQMTPRAEEAFLRTALQRRGWQGQLLADILSGVKGCRLDGLGAIALAAMPKQATIKMVSREVAERATQLADWLNLL